MATSNSTTVFPDNSTDANFRAWATLISALLDAAGFSKTADTGQINTATVLKPAATNTAQGYEIRTFNDSLQATAPIYFKIEYGSGSSTSIPSLWLTFGTGSDGAGSLTGVLHARMQFKSQTNSTTVGNKSFLSGNAAEGRLGMVLFLNGTTQHILMVAFERSRDSAGADTSEGVDVFAYSNAAPVQQHIPRSNLSIPSAETSFGCVAPTVGDGQLGSDTYFYAIRPFNRKELPPAKYLGAYFDTNFTAETPVTLTHYGQAMSFMPLGGSIFTTISRGVTATRMAIRWG